MFIQKYLYFGPESSTYVKFHSTLTEKSLLESDSPSPVLIVTVCPISLTNLISVGLSPTAQQTGETLIMKGDFSGGDLAWESKQRKQQFSRFNFYQPRFRVFQLAF